MPAKTETPFAKADEISARGMGIVVNCESCRQLRGMDDLHRVQINELKSQVSDLVHDLLSTQRSRNSWVLISGAVGFVCFLLVLFDLGWLK